MRRLITLLPTIIFILISCQQNLVSDQSKTLTDNGNFITKSGSTGKVTPDDPIVFIPATNMQYWTDIISLEDRFTACEVSSLRLKAMTTEALVKSMMNYPLNYIVFAYNNPSDAINLMIKYSSLHQEFLSRTDAAEVFVNLYVAADLDLSPGKGDYDGNYESLSYTNTMWMDYFLGSNILVGLDSDSIKQKLKDAITKKLNKRLDDSETFSRISIEPLLKIDENMSLGIIDSTRLSNMVLLYTKTVYTKLEHPVEAMVFAEMTTVDMEEITNTLSANYPNAIIKGASTRKYNCHSYAWYSQSHNNDAWINSYSQDGNFQLSKFWEHDKYMGCSSSDPELDVIYYSYGDHSARNSTGGKYISKWGQGPLMEHIPAYCPYPSATMVYYKEYDLNLNVSGQTPVVMNQEYTYNVTYSLESPSVSYEWEVRFMDAPSPKPFQLYVSSNGKSIRLKCEDYGLFKIIARAYCNGDCVDMAQLNVVAMPYL